MRAWTRAAGCWVAVALIAVTLRGAQASLLLGREELNRTYSDLVTDVEPIRNGPLTVRLSSSGNELTLTQHSLELQQMADGGHRSVTSAGFSGRGRVRAEIDLGGFPAAFESDVEFPSQLVVVEGTVAIARHGDGYEVTVRKLPRFAEIEMHSTLADQITAWCSRLVFFMAGNTACDELNHRLTHPRLPLPQAGESLFVAFSDLTADERHRIDSYLGGP